MTSNQESQPTEVQPLTAEQEAQIRAAVRANVSGLVWTPRTLAPLFATLDASREHARRVEAENQKEVEELRRLQDTVSLAWRTYHEYGNPFAFVELLEGYAGPKEEPE
jgi:hypothetical protein